MSAEEQNQKIKNVVEEWINKQGHERCWYYPDLFKKIVDILEINIPEPQLPSRQEFETGCKKYQTQEFGEKDILPKSPLVNFFLSIVIITQIAVLLYILVVL